MGKNSIEEDIKIIEKYLSHFKKVCSPEMLKKNEIIKVIQYKEIQALQHILSDYKRVLKENEELMELKISASAEYRIHNLQEENKRYKSENETLKCSIAVANKLEEITKEDFIPKGKIVDIIEKISLYKKLAKESIGQRIVIADSDSLEYGKMQAHNVDLSMLQELLESEETNDKNNKKG